MRAPLASLVVVASVSTALWASPAAAQDMPPGRPPSGYAQPGFAPPPPGYGQPGYYARRPAYRRNSPALMGVGITMITVGGIALLTGIVLTALPGPDTTTTCDKLGNCTTSTPTDVKRIVGIIMSGVGGIFVGVGVPLTLVGARKVPVDPNEPYEEAKRSPWVAAPHSQVAQSPLMLHLGAGSVGLSYQF